MILFVLDAVLEPSWTLPVHEPPNGEMRINTGFKHELKFGHSWS